mgnify:CR=1 FL=1
MSVENKQTLEVYQKTAHMYLTNTVEHDLLDPEKAKRKREKLNLFIAESFGSLNKGAKIFEIGSGDGTNAKYLSDIGYCVTASDTADDFIMATQEKCNDVIKLDVLQDDFPEKYNGIFCWRVFVHFTKEDAMRVLGKVYENLEAGGIFVFNAINRETKSCDAEWVDFPGEYHMGVERYYSYFTQKELDEMIAKIGFTVQEFHFEGGDSGNKWLVYVLKKQ